jgi:hypothetical protein
MNRKNGNWRTPSISPPTAITAAARATLSGCRSISEFLGALCSLSTLPHQQHSTDVTLFGQSLPSLWSPLNFARTRGENQNTAAHDVARNHHAAGSFILLSGISLTVQKVELLVKRLRRINPLMLEVITSILVVLSIGILVAHALDAFRP